MTPGWESSPSMRVFGAFLHATRENAGVDRATLAQAVGLSRHTLASIETGRRKADDTLPDRAAPLLGDPTPLHRALRHVTRETTPAAQQHHWDHARTHAITLYAYDNRMIPTMLQTDAYTRALHNGPLPPTATRPAHHDAPHEATTRPDTTFCFVIDHHALRSAVGGAHVTRELVHHLLTLSELPHVTIQLLPDDEPLHPGLWGPIALAETPDHRWTAHTETQGHPVHIHDATAVTTLKARFNHLRAQAHSPHHTRTTLMGMVPRTDHLADHRSPC